MVKRIHFTTVAALATTALAFGLLAGCGGSSDSDGESQPSAGSTVKKTSGKKPKRSDRRGHNPASAKDRRDAAPDDVIQDRPGGPKPPGSPQPQR